MAKKYSYNAQKIIMLLEFITNYFCPFTFFQSIFIAFYVSNLKKGLKQQNKLLAFFLLSFGITIGSHFFRNHPDLEKYQSIFLIGLNFRFFIAPLFYLYLRSIFKPAGKIKYSDFFHAGLFIFVIINTYTKQYLQLYSWSIYIYFDIIQMFVYIVWAFIEFKLIYLFIKPSFFNFSNRQIWWLQFFIISKIIIWLLLVFSIIFIYDNHSQWQYWSAHLVGFSNFIFINTVVYLSLKIPDFFISIKYKNTELPEAIQQRYYTRLLNFMETHKPYLNPSLSLKSLADELSISREHLSLTINNLFKQNFYHFINSYRIEACKKELLKKENGRKTVLNIALESGFYSKNTFNSAFKKITGMTPTEYKKHYSNKE